MVELTRFQTTLDDLKLFLEVAKRRLSEREWATLMACLAIYVENEYPREEREQVSA